jgi:hypothetical protein
MLSELQQRSVWENWLSAEIRANYFAESCLIYQRRQRVVTWLTLAASSGAFATLIKGCQPIWNRGCHRFWRSSQQR